jgi:hypothetical protein
MKVFDSACTTCMSAGDEREWELKHTLARTVCNIGNIVEHVSSYSSSINLSMTGRSCCNNPEPSARTSSAGASFGDGEAVEYLEN